MTSAALMSGELVYRTDLWLNEQGENNLPPMSEALHSILQADKEEVPRSCCLQLQWLKQARAANRQRRSRKIAMLESQLRSAAAVTESKLLDIVMSEEKRSAHLDSIVKQVQSRITTLSLLFYRIVQEEKRLCALRLRYENTIIDHMLENAKISQRLNLFCLHVQHETRGSIVVKKLQAAHPQYLRCQRAATENVKKDFFNGDDSRYSGVMVENVWKIENRILLDAFQSSAANSDPGKVKGLFCGVPADCLETLIVHGMKKREKAAAGKVFQDTWYEMHQKSKGGGESGILSRLPSTVGGGNAKKAVEAGTSIPFPRCFSRHSTLEEDREFVRNGGGADSLDGADSGVRFLALCRVMIGKIHVTGKNTKGFPHITDSSYDSMYSPTQEEYKLLNDSYVLPEFLVQYRFKGKVTLEGRPRGDDGSGVFDVDLSTPNIEGVKFAETKRGDEGFGVGVGGFGVRGGTAVGGGARSVGGVGVGSVSYIDEEVWLRCRQNAARQKQGVLGMVEAEIKRAKLLFNREKSKTFVERTAVDGSEDQWS